MKKRIVVILLCVVMALTFTACDTPKDMLELYKEARAKTGNTLDALGVYFTNYGTYSLMSENSQRDTTWDAAARSCRVLNGLPQLMDKIDLIEIRSDKIAEIHMKDDDYVASLEKYVELLKGYGYSYLEYKKDKDKYRLRFYMETEDEPIAVTITGYERKYEQTYNVDIHINKSKYNNPF